MPSVKGKGQLESKKNGDPIPSIETVVNVIKNRDGDTKEVIFDFFGAGNYFKEINPLRNAINKKG